jgi:LuxR family transcriptional regulator, maltose regulon positive regulatory protein
MGPAILPRPRLTGQLARAENRRLFFILGQAAQGKSTLAASYTKTQAIPTGWLNLDQGDSDPVNLFYWIVNTLQYSLPDLDFSPLRAYPAIGRSPRPVIPLYREWTEALFGRIVRPIQLVLDGLDRLSKGAPSLLFLQTLIHEALPHLHLIILSREEPFWALQDLRMKQTAYILTNEDLAFTPGETEAFFRELQGMTLTDLQIRKIHSFTESWVGGLLLFSEALKRLPEEDRDPYIAEKMPDRFRREVSDFFREAILSSQPREIA